VRLTGKAALFTGATGEFGRAIARVFAGRRSWSIHDVQALQMLAPLSGSYVPWSWSAMRPSGLVAVLSDVCVNGRKHILECGGGVSTVYLARLLRERGGSLVTLEHDEGWAKYVSLELERDEVADRAAVHLAPLERNPVSPDGSDWYAQGAVEEAVSALGEIDLLLVDGPPAFEREDTLARYPALPSFAEALTEDCTVVLDDIERKGERRVVERWEDESSFEFQRRIDPGGIAIGRPRGYSVLGI
jgi:predicted O-methyltransferase YrrM